MECRRDKGMPPLALDVRMTENTGQMDVGEGVLWRSKVEPTSFKIYIADPVSGQVALQGRVKVQGRDTLIAIRLRVDRGRFPRSNSFTRAASRRRRSSC